MKTPGKMVVAPGAFDGISARLIAEAGFEAIYMTGAGTAASRIGQPDLGLITLTEMVANAGAMAECTGLPVIADADTGYGNPPFIPNTQIDRSVSCYGPYYCAF